MEWPSARVHKNFKKIALLYRFELLEAVDLNAVLRQAEQIGRIVDIADGGDRVEIFVD